MRSFIALDINDEEVINRLARVALMLNLRGVKPVERENLHITIRFLGEISEPMVQEVISALRKVRYKQIFIRISSLGAFPSLKRPRVIWAGIKEGFSELIELHELIEYELKNIRLRLEREDFHPHVTLARIKENSSINEVIKILESNLELEFGSFIAKDFSLKQSILTPRGPIYRDIERFPL